MRNPPLIGIVGVCASGKSTLTNKLKVAGYDCRHIAQEHSYVADMWERLVDPDVLIFLDASYQTTIRRKRLNWTIEEYQVQLHRLRHALNNASIIVPTDDFSSDEVFEFVTDQINLINTH
jgi:deoxyadenosine/deoxycytidine kinase